MSDVFTTTKRSEVMSKIRGCGNKGTELALMKLFRQHRVTGWRRNQKVFGKPDFVFRREKVAVFVDGCFWHGCPRHCKIPVGNRAFWEKKFAANKARDRRVNRELRKLRWRVVRIWEHDLAKRGEASIWRIQAATNPTSAIPFPAKLRKPAGEATGHHQMPPKPCRVRDRRDSTTRPH
jgi:DNA mismatch endonuclease (patch repair protein)